MSSENPVKNLKGVARPDLFRGAPLIPGNPGNSGGKRGRSGRKPDAWMQFWREVANTPAVLSGVAEILLNSDVRNPQSGHLYLKALAWAVQQAYPRASKTTELSSHDRFVVRFD